MDDIKDFGANIVVLDMIGTNYDENQQLDEILRCKNGVKYIFLIDSKQKKEAMLKIESSRVPDGYIEYNKKPEDFFEELPNMYEVLFAYHMPIICLLCADDM